MNNFTVCLKLNKLNNVIITEEEIEGVMEKGLFIPFRYNPIYVTNKKDCKLSMTAMEMKPNKFGQSHFLLPRCNQKEREKLERLGQPINILGNIYVQVKKGYNYSLNKKNEVSLDDALSIE